MKNIKVVAFDCDGVMFDTAEANRVYYSKILEHFGRPALTAEQFAVVHMHTVDESLAHLFPDKKDLAAAQAYRRGMNYQVYLKYLTLEPHLVSLLARIRPAMKTAIVTNRTDTMHRLLAEFGLEDGFDLVVTASDVEQPKPHPEGLIKILRHFDISPRQAVYIGDSPLDAAAAKAAGIPLVAYDNPQLPADYHIASLRELEDLLELPAEKQP